MGGCGGGCHCSGKSSPASCGMSGVDYLGSVTLVSELFAEPSEDHPANVRSLWSALTPGEQCFAAGQEQWAGVNEQLYRWFSDFSEDLALLENATGRFAEIRGRLSKDQHQRFDVIADGFHDLGPLIVRESHFTRRGEEQNAQACKSERLRLLENSIVPALTWTDAEMAHLNSKWFASCLSWARAVAVDLNR